MTPTPFPGFSFTPLPTVVGPLPPIDLAPYFAAPDVWLVVSRYLEMLALPLTLFVGVAIGLWVLWLVVTLFGSLRVAGGLLLSVGSTRSGASAIGDVGSQVGGGSVVGGRDKYPSDNVLDSGDYAGMDYKRWHFGDIVRDKGTGRLLQMTEDWRIGEFPVYQRWDFYYGENLAVMK